jgi:hypothetical protein
VLDKIYIPIENFILIPALHLDICSDACYLTRCLTRHTAMAGWKGLRLWLDEILIY